MQKWEYAWFYWEGQQGGQSRWVSFSHRGKWEPIRGDEYRSVMHRLGEEGFELVSAVTWSTGGGGYGGEQLYFRRPIAE